MTNRLVRTFPVRACFFVRGGLGKAGGLVGLGKAGGLGVLGGSHVVPRTPLQTLRRADFNNMSKKIAICT